MPELSPSPFSKRAPSAHSSTSVQRHLAASPSVGPSAGAGAGAALGAAAGAFLARRWTPRRAAAALEKARPPLGSALQAYVEGGGGTLRPQLEAWVAQRLGPAWLPASLARLAVAAGLALMAALLSRPQPAPTVHARESPPPGLSVTARLEPPGYTGWPAVEVPLPHVRGLRHSRLLLDVRTSALGLRWAEEGGPEQQLLAVDGRAGLSFSLEHSGSLRLVAEGGGPVVLLQLEALPDGPPRVTLEAPESDRTLTAAPGPLTLRASAEDDVRVADLGFRWTLARGHAEGMQFENGRLPGHLTSQGRTAQAAARLDPLALGMKAGDTLVLWAEATDSNTLDGPGVGRSEARLLRWEEALVDVSSPLAGARLPPPLSQPSERELLARTERLVRSGTRGARLREQSAVLADVQRHIREAFGFFLQQESHSGLELDVDEAEVAQSGDARARRLLAQAVSEMWAAESELAIGTPAAALAPERAAVKALEAAFGNERLALRPSAPPDRPVDEGRRLSGAQGGLRPRPDGRATLASPDQGAVAQLARRLLLSAEQGVTAETARLLADALWGLPVNTGIPAASLAAPLYAAGDDVSRDAAARAAAVALARWLRPSPDVVPPVSPDEAAVVDRLPLRPPPP